jgi:hypothetical protein
MLTIAETTEAESKDERINPSVKLLEQVLEEEDDPHDGESSDTMNSVNIWSPNSNNDSTVLINFRNQRNF